MMIDIKPEIVEDLRELLTVLEDVANAHVSVHDNEELIEPWTPSDSHQQIDCPNFTAGLIRKVFRIKKSLRL